MRIKENKGVTLVALTITIVVLLIIASIGVYSGKETIQKANACAVKRRTGTIDCILAAGNGRMQVWCFADTAHRHANW